MSRRSFYSITPIAWLGSAALAVSAVELPDGATFKVKADIDKLSDPPACTMDARGGWYFAVVPPGGDPRPDQDQSAPWFADDMASTTVQDRQALLEKWKEKLPLAVDAASSPIIRHLDEGATGLESAAVFADGFDGLLDGADGGMLHHDGVLYFASVPELMMLRDADGDGKAEQRKLIQSGFGVKVSLPGHGFGGLTLGPDGRVYGTIGDKGMNFTTKVGAVCRFPNRGAAFRFELDGSGFECFHSGLRNPGKVAFDANGNAFTMDENPGGKGSARVIYLVDGGDSGWEMEIESMISFPGRIGLRQTPANRWSDGQSASVLPPAGGLDVRPAGFTHHPGAGYLESGLGRFFVGDLRPNQAESAVWSFEAKPDGAGMAVTGARKELSGISPSDVGFSPDGNLWVADGVDGRLIAVDAGAKTWMQQEAASAAKLLKEGFHQRSSAELVNFLRHPDARVRLFSQLALTRKNDALAQLTEATLSSNPMVRAHGIRGLGIIVRCGALPEPFNDFAAIPSGDAMGGALGRLTALTEDQDAQIRCEALHALASARDDAPDLNLGLLLDDDSPRVRYFAAQVVARRKLAGFFDPICEMLEKNANKDPWLRQAGAYALQQMAPDSSLLRALVDHESSAVRLAAVIGLRRIESPDVEMFLGDADPLVADEAVRTVCDLDLAEARPAVAAWFESKDAAKLTPVMLRRMMHNSFQIGDAGNAATILKLALDATVPDTLREEAFRLLGCWAEPPPFDGFTGKSVVQAPRDPAEVIALLRKNLPALSARDHTGIAAAQNLAKIYQIDASIIPSPVKAAPPASSGYEDIHNPPVTRNPWLYIVIGLLVVTGILLYVDPRIF